MPVSPEEIRKNLLESFMPTDIITATCSHCSAGDPKKQIEIYQNIQVPFMFALFCPECGALFFLSLPMDEGFLEPVGSA